MTAWLWGMLTMKLVGKSITQGSHHAGLHHLSVHNWLWPGSLDTCRYWVSQWRDTASSVMNYFYLWLYITCKMVWQSVNRFPTCLPNGGYNNWNKVLTQRVWDCDHWPPLSPGGIHLRVGPSLAVVSTEGGFHCYSVTVLVLAFRV